MLDANPRALRNLSGPIKNENVHYMQQLDRFIPNRSASNFDLLFVEKHDTSSPSKEAYCKQLRKALNLDGSRIFAFKNKPSAPVELWPQDYDYTAVRPSKPVKQHHRSIPKVPVRTLDLPDLEDDYYINPLDWGSGNLVAIAIANTIYIWNASNSTRLDPLTVHDVSPVTSLSWAQDGKQIAVGLENSLVQLWDVTTRQKLRAFKGGHLARVGSLAWNKHLLTSGSSEGRIINNDLRARDHIVGTYRGHKDQICGLKWSHSGQQLASGGNDNLLFIWDQSMASSRRASTQWLHKFEDHRAAVKALAWCPFQSNLLASGGGTADRCIKFWNTHTGVCLNSINTESQTSTLLWSKTDRELLSSHGFPDNQLTLCKYPSMVKMTDLCRHESRVLHMAQSPDGCTVASAGADETLLFWKVFRKVVETSQTPGLFAHAIRTSIR